VAATCVGQRPPDLDPPRPITSGHEKPIMEQVADHTPSWRDAQATASLCFGLRSAREEIPQTVDGQFPMRQKLAVAYRLHQPQGSVDHA
jgi:hypothetical protein